MAHSNGGMQYTAEERCYDASLVTCRPGHVEAQSVNGVQVRNVESSDNCRWQVVQGTDSWYSFCVQVTTT